MSTSSSLRQQFGAFCTNVPLGVRTLLEAPGLTTTLTAPKTALCVCVSTPGQKVFVHWFNGRGCLEKAPKPATCVCPPLDKGSSTTTLSTLHGQGGSDPFSSHCLTKTLLIGCDIRRGRSPNVPAEFSTRCHPTLPLFDSWSFMFPPPNLSFAADLSRQFTTADMQPSQAKQSMFKHFQVVGLFAMLFYRLPSQRGNCVN